MTNWTAIQKELKKRAPGTAAPPADAFWADFAARARFVNQDSPRPSRYPVLWASMATAGLAALLAVILWPGQAVAEVTRVTFLEVGAPHSGAMILNVVSENGHDSGAIVWVSGLEEDTAHD